ncbi:hypothetical protein [Streptomyces sp. NPDC052535]|uniref:hypothetical protein n=1 Tax=Streptomyces sp. NPDC052535 TaxID=3155531 RepID=UPI00344AA13C
MIIVRRVLRIFNNAPPRWSYGVPIALNSAALALILLWPPGGAPVRTAVITVTSITLLTLLVTYKPFAAYQRAAQEAAMAWDAVEVLTHEARAALAHAEAMLGEAESAGDFARKEEAAQAAQCALARLRALTPALEPKMATLQDTALLANDLWERMPHRRAARWARRSLQSRLAVSLMALAVVLAGQRGARMRDTWMVDLIGVPEEGLTLTGWTRVRHSVGFVRAALRMRSRVALAVLWRPIDWLLATESRTSTLIALTVGAQVIYIHKHDGLYKLLTEGWGWCAGCAVALHFFFRWLRKIRGIELAVSGQDASER